MKNMNPPITSTAADVREIRATMCPGGLRLVDVGGEVRFVVFAAACMCSGRRLREDARDVTVYEAGAPSLSLTVSVSPCWRTEPTLFCETSFRNVE